MKRFWYVLAMLWAVCLASCEEQPEPAGKSDYLAIATTSLQLDHTKGYFFLEVDSNVEWSVACSAEWITLGESEYSGAANVLVNYLANEQDKSRSAIVRVESAKANSAEILVTQRGKNSGGNVEDGGDLGGDEGSGDDSGEGGNTGNEGGSDDGKGDDNGSGNEGDGGNTGDSGNGGNTGGSGDDSGNTGGGTDGVTKYAGWAELPVEEENSDYYYAYHMRPDKSTQRNFSVCYSAEMACPVWVACPIHSCYVGSASRSSYSQDPVIPASVQVKPEAGDTNKGNWMNRGHMLASNMRTVSSATNKQVFYYTNIAPQNGNNFNTGGGWWNDMEDIEKGDYMCADTLYTVNGCHWANKNETFNGQVVPTHFYKVFLRTKRGNSGKWVVNCSASELQCVAFYVPHTVGKTTPSRSHMISVSELERITGHTFFSNVPNAPKDTFNPSDWGM